MRIKCVSNKALPESHLEAQSGMRSTAWHDLQVGEKYIVYAASLCEGRLSYRISVNMYLSYPAALFKIVDGRISRCWVHWYRGECAEEWELGRVDAVFSFPEFAGADHDAYVEKLIDGDREAIDVFKEYKELMDLEFPDPAVTYTASRLERNWLMCPLCCEVWEISSRDGMVRCPECQTVLHNPNYEDRYP